MDKVTPIRPGVKAIETLDPSVAVMVASKAMKRLTTTVQELTSALEDANSELLAERAKNDLLCTQLMYLERRARQCEESAHG